LFEGFFGRHIASKSTSYTVEESVGCTIREKISITHALKIETAKI
jgi:hypothetical protein